MKKKALVFFVVCFLSLNICAISNAGPLDGTVWMKTVSLFDIISFTHYFGFYQDFVYAKGEDVPIIGDVAWNKFDGSLPYFAIPNPVGGIDYSFIRFSTNSFTFYWGTCDVENEEGSFNFFTTSVIPLTFENEGYELVETEWSPPPGTLEVSNDVPIDIILPSFF
jgi:hypothetical protein